MLVTPSRSLLPNADPAAPIDEARRRRMLNAISLAGAVVAMVAHTLRVAFGTAPSIASWIAFCVVASSLWVTVLLLRLKVSVARAALLPIVAMVAGIPLLASLNGGLNAPVITLAPAVPVVAAIFLDTKKAVVVAIVLGVEVMGVALLAQMGWLPTVKVAPLAKGAILVAYMFVNVVIVAAAELERRNAEAKLRGVATSLYRSSILDPLTQVYNRRHFAERLAHELGQARHRDADIGVIALDADHFKQINDGHGHDAGDVVLTELAALLRRELRADDVVARFGGEEFVVLTRGIGHEQLAVVAERLRAAVAAHTFELDGVSIRVTVSVGCATARGAAASEDLLSLADERMYTAKKSGRNRVVSDDSVALASHIRFVSSIPLASLPAPFRLSSAANE
jgi:diguanylate cyclase (GGDEF)-like protein